jgi:hypothetical protein
VGDAGERARDDTGADPSAAPAVRVGDTERRAVDTRLQRAHGEGMLTLGEYEERAALAWAARTRTELDALTRDLPPEHAVPATAVATTSGPAAVVAPTRKGWPERLVGAVVTIAVAGAAVWLGGELVTADDATAVFSSRTVPVADDRDRVEVGVLFASADVVVPDDARVVQTGTTIFGSVDCEAACDGPGTREVAVDVSGAFGSVDIRTRSEAAAERAEEARDEADDRDRGEDDG